jgi:hypothetical protein
VSAIESCFDVPVVEPRFKRPPAVSADDAVRVGRILARREPLPEVPGVFQSGFPYAGDQRISLWATGWASMALAQAIDARVTTGKQLGQGKLQSALEITSANDQRSLIAVSLTERFRLKSKQSSSSGSELDHAVQTSTPRCRTEE